MASAPDEPELVEKQPEGDPWGLNARPKQVEEVPGSTSPGEEEENPEEGKIEEDHSGLFDGVDREEKKSRDSSTPVPPPPPRLIRLPKEESGSGLRVELVQQLAENVALKTSLEELTRRYRGDVGRAVPVSDRARGAAKLANTATKLARNAGALQQATGELARRMAEDSEVVADAQKAEEAVAALARACALLNEVHRSVLETTVKRSEHLHSYLQKIAK
ncbi:hypothetical protein KKA13_01280 [Patescibacteria group bacterium]|nr:hypothetical protein [Patescibacteria group bacterium]MBU1613244.1 hypothetical protein [Patescibacteria group bacterium]